MESYLWGKNSGRKPWLVPSLTIFVPSPQTPPVPPSLVLSRACVLCCDSRCGMLFLPSWPLHLFFLRSPLLLEKSLSHPSKPHLTCHFLTRFLFDPCNQVSTYTLLSKYKGSVYVRRVSSRDVPNNKGTGGNATHEESKSHSKWS